MAPVGGGAELHRWRFLEVVLWTLIDQLSYEFGTPEVYFAVRTFELQTDKVPRPRHGHGQAELPSENTEDRSGDGKVVRRGVTRKICGHRQDTSMLQRYLCVRVPKMILDNMFLNDSSARASIFNQPCTQRKWNAIWEESWLHFVFILSCCIEVDCVLDSRSQDTLFFECSLQENVIRMKNTSHLGSSKSCPARLPWS